MKHTSEAAFETAIEQVLLSNGYSRPQGGFDPRRAIFPDEVLGFIRDTQPDTWKKLQALHKKDTGKRVLESLCKRMDKEGALGILRHGFKHHGQRLHIAYFRPSHGLNARLESRYQANRLGIIRQLHYSAKNENSLDVVLSLNGIPVVTVELKNPMSGQTARDAMHQYRHTRDPREPIFAFAKRTLVHFAVDTDEVQMTTRLAGEATRFLPFNRGDQNGAGNAPDEQGRNYKTAYLWEEVLQRDSLMDLLARFLHRESRMQTGDRGKKTQVESLIFPRYHQLTAVRKMEQQARKDGAGNSYLVEHSAGSGKSNTIAWLAYRLSSLHNDNDERIFDSVVVVTDRIVLDKQLQDTIYQFEHRHGVVQKIDKDSRQLAQALESGVPIIITTLQKFPFVPEHLEAQAAKKGRMPTRKYAVIVDEAHSSQAGETSLSLKGVLGGGALFKEAELMAKKEGAADLQKLFLSMARRGRRPNLSYFAFTATPKHKTMKIFGKDGKPSHCYTMRQAIQEGFIMDVLKNYMSYKTYYKLIKKAEEDPNVRRKAAASALARFFRLHPSNVAQKVEIMVEHFQRHSRHKIGGHAKAMVLTDSRLAVVRYKQGFDKYIRDKGYAIKTLVAFSGQVEDDKVPGTTYTETQMNGGIREQDLPETFAGDEYRLLLVAEKYQTGFDQPLLHTMYVDKRLGGIQAVQALSRLNRIHPLKEDTFILDFVNDPEEILEAFAQYYRGAEMGDEVDPDKLYEIQSDIAARDIYRQDEVNAFCFTFYAPKKRQTAADHKKMNAILDKAVKRYQTLLGKEEQAAEDWRGKARAFRRLYSFLSQVIPYQDSDLEKLATYLRYLATKLPRRNPGPNYHFDEKVGLSYYRLQKLEERRMNMEDAYAIPLDGPGEMGTGMVREEEVLLSRLIDEINQRFGGNLTEADQLLFDQLAEAACEDQDMRQIAAGNPLDKFLLKFVPLLETLFVERMELNEELLTNFLEKPELQELISHRLGQEVYERLRQPKDAA